MRLALILFVPFVLFGSSPEEILVGMSLEEKIGQLFIAPGCPKRGVDHLEDWKTLLDEFHIGNVIVKQSNSADQVRFLNALQRETKRPLLVVADAEWGLSMTMEDAPPFPKNMTLGAIQEISLIERLGEEIGREAQLVGVHMNLAPVVDVNNNPNNSVIHMRSFGDQSAAVAERGAAMIRGMKKSGLLTCTKHFPGHGDTEVDSHFGLPIISHSLERLKEIELPPFKAAIEAGTDAVMSAHILLKALDLVPATLSFPVMTTLLRHDLGFNGLIVTDALNMKALINHYSVEEIVLMAHAAGADLLLYGDHVTSAVDSLIQEQIPKAYRALLSAYQDGTFSMSRLDASVLRILQAKDQVTNWIVDENPKLRNGKVGLLRQQLYQAAVTQLGVDFAPLDPDVAYLSVGGSGKEDFIFPGFCPCSCSTWEERSDVFSFERIVISLRNIDPKEKKYGLTDEQLAFFAELASTKKVVFCLFGTPYAASLLPKNGTILIGYEEEAQRAVLNVLTGERKAQGRLPITL